MKHATTWMILNNITLHKKKSIPEDYKLDNYNYERYLKQIHKESRQISNCLGLGQGGTNEGDVLPVGNGLPLGVMVIPKLYCGDGFKPL